MREVESGSNNVEVPRGLVEAAVNGDVSAWLFAVFGEGTEQGRVQLAWMSAKGGEENT